MPATRGPAVFKPGTLDPAQRHELSERGSLRLLAADTDDIAARRSKCSVRCSVFCPPWWSCAVGHATAARRTTSVETASPAQANAASTATSPSNPVVEPSNTDPTSALIA
jgi:hypothetical protein